MIDKNLKILFCIPTSPVKTLGGSKVVVELAEALGELGWTYDFLNPSDLVTQSRTGKTLRERSREELRRYLNQNAHRYDVIDYDVSFLPYSRAEFPNQVLMVGRSVLLAHHFTSEIAKKVFPIKRNWKYWPNYFLRSQKWLKERQQSINVVNQTIGEADLINVPNYQDELELTKAGISKDKIVVLPYGLAEDRIPLFELVSVEIPNKPIVVFVGTFDNRKGSFDFPSIVKNILISVPEVSFCLLGTSGLYQSRKEVLNCFPKALRTKIEVIPKFDPKELPKLLARCSVGIFPSYVESFGFGVLEMLAASIPVIAYDAPGPPMMLDPEYLVPRGDAVAMAQKVVDLLQNPDRLKRARIWARERSQQFCWRQIAQHTSEIYIEHWRRKQGP